MSILFSLSLAMVAGLLANRGVKKIGLPNVTAYLVAGLLIGVSGLKIISEEELAALSTVVNLALGFIAFSIGGEFKVSSLKRIGSAAMTITFFQALSATACVDAVLIFCGFPLPLALTLGAIATATAPAATLMVVRQYHARGPVTNILLPVVALDDAIGLVVFSVSLAAAQVLANGEELSVGSMLLNPLREIGLSLLLGTLIGLAIAVSLHFFHSKANFLMVIITGVALGTAMADAWGLSSLLLCMMIGVVVANLRADSDKMMGYSDEWTPPLFLLFFILSGAELDVRILPSVGVLGVLYLLSRSLGKYVGAALGAAIARVEPNIRKYLGITLLPQAGVAIGMSQIVIGALPQYGPQIRAVVLSATLVYELVGPLLTKMALTAAGEIEPAAKKAA